MLIGLFSLLFLLSLVVLPFYHSSLQICIPSFLFSGISKLEKVIQVDESIFIFKRDRLWYSGREKGCCTQLKKKNPPSTQCLKIPQNISLCNLPQKSSSFLHLLAKIQTLRNFASLRIQMRHFWWFSLSFWLMMASATMYYSIKDNRLDRRKILEHYLSLCSTFTVIMGEKPYVLLRRREICNIAR